MTDPIDAEGVTRMESSTWSWSPRRPVPWLGVLLVVFGLALLVDQLTPLSTSALVLGALAIAFAASWLIGGSRWAMVPALVLAALAIPDALTDLGVITGDGWGSAALTVAFLAIWLVGGRSGRRPGWSLWLAVIFGIVGLTQLSHEFSWLPSLDALWPVVFIVVGVALILGRGRRGPSAPW